MVLTLAFRNLFHDRIRLSVTLVGILFSIVLVAVQLGLYLGARKMIISMIENANGELWVTSYGAKSFEEASALPGRERHIALSTPGVKAVVPLVVSFSEWRKPAGGSALSVIVGTDPADGGLAPWNIIAGSVADISVPESVAVDRTYLDSLGINGVGDTAQIEASRVKVAALTNGIRSFTTAPYVFTPINRARSILGMQGDQSTFLLVQLQPGADVAATRAELASFLEVRPLPDDLGEEPASVEVGRATSRVVPSVLFAVTTATSTVSAPEAKSFSPVSSSRPSPVGANRTGCGPSAPQTPKRPPERATPSSLLRASPSACIATSLSAFTWPSRRRPAERLARPIRVSIRTSRSGSSGSCARPRPPSAAGAAAASRPWRRSSATMGAAGHSCSAGGESCRMASAQRSRSASNDKAGSGGCRRALTVIARAPPPSAPAPARSRA